MLSVDSAKLRPATDRLRETLFAILMNIVDLEGAAVLDLYAGTGSVGFEAVSRGAGHAVFVEADPKIAGVLKRNALILGVSETCDVRMMDVEKFLGINDDKFDIVFVDPPYAANASTNVIIDKILSSGAVGKSGLVCVEHSRSYSPDPSLLIRQKIFGSTILSLLKPEKKCLN